MAVVRGTLANTNSGASVAQPVRSFLVCPIVSLHDDDASAERTAHLKLIPLTALAGQRGGGREKSGWSELACPATIAKRRLLVR